MHELAHLLALPGPVWGSYPMRPADDLAPPWRRPRLRSALAACRQAAHGALAHAEAWQRLDRPARVAALHALRATLRRDGLHGAPLAQALGLASACATELLGQTPRASQRLAAAALLDNRMAEMATGEGKTLAIALAAAVAALAGVPVHVVTANEYLAARDAAQMAPVFGALGLRAAALCDAGTDAARRAVYQHDIVYATAKELAFDFLRDRQAMAGTQELERIAAAVGGQGPALPLMRGLCMALLDEADSILLDEAEVPLILSRSVPHAARRAFLWQALALARQLDSARDFVLHQADRVATLTAAGEQRLALLASPLGGPWQRPRYRREAVLMALAGLHAYHRNTHYLVRDGAIELLDEVTGRVAPGRVWSRGLQTVVALKEGLHPAPETETVAQTTFQRFFQRYWRLCGISGTLWDARGELAAVYGVRVVRIPLHLPGRRHDLPPRRFGNAQAMFGAMAGRIGALSAAGRPVLVGTDSVADSERLSQLLHARGITHRVLNALHDADEAAIICEAGCGGRVTVATRMAGRGTDIALDAAAHAAGGLHVLSCQHNASRRLDRQLAGRAARHGDPGSAEIWSFDGYSGPASAPLLTARSTDDQLPALRGPAWIALAPKRWAQWREENRRAVLRHILLEQDLFWERRLAFAGAPV